MHRMLDKLLAHEAELYREQLASYDATWPRISLRK
jgi:hypothetical protein